MPNTHVSRARLQPQAHTHDDPPQPRCPAPVLSLVHATAEIVRDGGRGCVFDASWITREATSNATPTKHKAKKSRGKTDWYYNVVLNARC